MPLTPVFHQNISQLIQFLNGHNIHIYGIADLMNSSNPNDEFIKIYVNYPNAGVVAHRPICPDRPNLISGYADATENGFWVGMFRREEIIYAFGSMQDFVDQVGRLYGYSNNSLCQRCNP
ncbi:hypothetical protein [Thermodesulfatator autotrophicus]|uniref:Uncharacterized protein n=1 Tax=Thermodesulfatator autotrophicus TaxID=1795632 RepID=A0A177E7N0_9BACT|nr:hypothetical protein [Thermodesulfatator autotrophicus]OAG27029.1 hypothetical protein TH606_09110 [Thermodesulfatator autotrophicus]